MGLPTYDPLVTNVLHALALHDDQGGGTSDRRWPIADNSGDTTSSVELSDADQAIVDGIRTGDEHALEQLYTTYYAELQVIAARMTGSSTFSDDVVNDVFHALWTLRNDWSPRHGIRAYLIRAVRNRARNVVRAEASRWRTEQAAVSQGDVEGAPPGMGTSALASDARLDADEVARIVWDVVERLSESAQLILTLRWQHGLAWDAIAHAMGLSVGAVQMQHNRACKLLRQRLPRYLK